ncbi:MAG: DNA polymerase I, partial [Opitutaceae bacterium]|nr:DNA polymerase I [Opitutaceae bacterium]
MLQKLFLLDGMALAYRAHFAFITRPIVNSQGLNTSAIYGFTNTLLDLIQKQKPTHMALVFDTSAPTERHEIFPEYKANRDEMPEDLSIALPHLRRIAEAFQVPVLTLDGYEADDIIGTLALRAEKEEITSYMVTPDKDFGQLVTDKTFIFRPSYKGDAPEILGVKEVCEKWGIERVDQVIDILGLAGDSVDNIPGVPGVGPKTAQKLLALYDSVEGILENVEKLKGKQKEKFENFADQALLSKKLATINIQVPIKASIEGLILKSPDMDAVKSLFAEFEFRTLTKRLFGETAPAPIKTPAKGETLDLFAPPPPSKEETEEASADTDGQLELISATPFQTIENTPHTYKRIITGEERIQLADQLSKEKSFCFDTETTSLIARKADLVGIAFSHKAHEGWFVHISTDSAIAAKELAPFKTVFENAGIQKVGHNLKYDIAVLKHYDIRVEGPLFDTMLAHSLVEPEQRHKMDYLAETCLNYSPIPFSKLIGEEKENLIPITEAPPEQLAEYATEDADITWQLYQHLTPLLKECDQEKVFYEIEVPLIRTLIDMEDAGISIDTVILGEYSKELAAHAEEVEKQIFEEVGHEFNLKSPKQLGEVLFEELKLIEKPKKTRTGQYATNEQILSTLANDHPIIARILDYRGTVKLKNTYVDTLPGTVDPTTNRIHTTFGQLLTATGRLQSNSPNLQNIPIRTEQGRKIRKAFIAKDTDHRLISADYSQIELRIIAALSKDEGMLKAFRNNEDIHLATAAKIYNVSPEEVTREMRSKAKMVNFGIPYGISAFGLAQRLNIPRREAAELIEQYFAQFSGIANYIEETLLRTRKLGYAETVTGRKRQLRDINSANQTMKKAANRNAINMPIQGTAADMIKLAMAHIHQELVETKMATRLLLQVHD